MNADSVIYIQNESISGNVEYHADKVYIGSNVSALKPNGPVFFTGGKVTIKADNVTIQGETTVNLGTEFEIKNE